MQSLYSTVRASTNPDHFEGFCLTLKQGVTFCVWPRRFGVTKRVLLGQSDNFCHHATTWPVPSWHDNVWRRAFSGEQTQRFFCWPQPVWHARAPIPAFPQRGKESDTACSRSVLRAVISASQLKHHPRAEPADVVAGVLGLAGGRVICITWVVRCRAA